MFSPPSEVASNTPPNVSFLTLKHKEKHTNLDLLYGSYSVARKPKMFFSLPYGIHSRF